MPQLLRVVSKSELIFGVIHDHQMAHSCSRCASADMVRFDQGYTQTSRRCLGRAGSTNDPASGYNHIE
jgi:hypothetical protein